MARVVVLSFADDDAAEQFCRKLTAIQDHNDTTANVVTVGMLVSAFGHLEGLLARPTRSCPHAFRYGTFKRTSRFGWYVHAETVGGQRCWKPAPGVVKNYIRNILMSGGNNLLPELLAKPPTVGVDPATTGTYVTEVQT